MTSYQNGELKVVSVTALKKLIKSKNDKIKVSQEALMEAKDVVEAFVNKLAEGLIKSAEANKRNTIKPRDVEVVKAVFK